jgi:hypothetical protein
MRDDRYKGTSLPRPVQKLCRMAEREADRARPELLRQQAFKALMSDANREIHPMFRRLLLRIDSVPTLFIIDELAAMARSGLEVAIARNMGLRQCIDSMDGLLRALRERIDAYVREQKCRLITDRVPNADAISGVVRQACHEVTVVVATQIMVDQPIPNVVSRVRLTENLLAPLIEHETKS